jgi:hypothetical protein
MRCIRAISVVLLYLVISTRICSFRLPCKVIPCRRGQGRLFSKPQPKENFLVNILDKNGDGILSIKEAVGSPFDILQNSLVSNNYKTVLKGTKLLCNWRETEDSHRLILHSYSIPKVAVDICDILAPD